MSTINYYLYSLHKKKKTEEETGKKQIEMKEKLEVEGGGEG